MSYPASSYPYSAYQHPQPPTTSPYPHYQPQPPYSGAQGYAAWPYGYTFQQPPPPPRPSVVAAPPATSSFASYTPAYQKESSTSAPRGPRKQSNLKGLFAKELPKLMYGFGDDKQVSNDTVNVMEEILIEYLVDVCQSALVPTRKARLQIEDLRRALSRPADAKKLARMEELLFMQEDIKRARKQFNEDEVNASIEF